MKTVGEFKKAGLVFVEGDACKQEGITYVAGGWAELENEGYSEWLDNVVTEFAWRTNTGVEPEFSGLIDVKFIGDINIYYREDPAFYWEDGSTEQSVSEWRPHLSAATQTEAPEEKEAFEAMNKSPYDVDARVSGDKVKPVFTQAMADTQYELEWHKANSKLLANLTDFMVKNNIGKVGDSCIDVAIRELSEYHGIETRTPKQKAVDDALKLIGFGGDGEVESHLNAIYDLWKR